MSGADAAAALRDVRRRLDRLPPRPRRSPAERDEVAGLLAERWRVLDEAMRAAAVPLYDEVTGGCTTSPRAAEVVYAVAERHPDLLPTRERVAAEHALPQKDKDGVEIDQGIFLSHVLADPRAGRHLLHSMSQPRPEALARLDELRRRDAVDLGTMLVERDGRVGHVTICNHRYLNAEDDASTAALEAAVDLVLLDDRVDVGLLRGGVAEHPRYAGRRVFGAGINLTHLYAGRISLIEFFVDRELGALGKMYRGHDLAAFDDAGPERRREKPWIAAVESFAIGGACQTLLVMDRVVAERGSYFNLPARREGIVPGLANLRLPRMVGERLARQAIFFNRDLAADSREGRLLADEIVAPDEVDASVRRAAEDLVAAGTTSLVANRRQLRAGAEPLDVFRRYMAGYAREQAHCLYSPALIANLERNWEARRRRRGA